MVKGILFSLYLTFFTGLCMSWQNCSICIFIGSEPGHESPWIHMGLKAFIIYPAHHAHYLRMLARRMQDIELLHRIQDWVPQNNPIPKSLTCHFFATLDERSLRCRVGSFWSLQDPSSFPPGFWWVAGHSYHPLARIMAASAFCDTAISLSMYAFISWQ